MPTEPAPLPSQVSPPPELALATPIGGPDPRLAQLVRLLARRAARRWVEQNPQERGPTGS